MLLRCILRRNGELRLPGLRRKLGSLLKMHVFCCVMNMHDYTEALLLTDANQNT